jgi:dienelactone hydrolase
MAHVALFHSILGLRPVELHAAERLRRAGHRVTAPDLFGGETARTLDAGFALLDRIGWETVVERARRSLAGLPGATVLAGVSMGVGVVTDLWPERPDTAGVVLMHAVADPPASLRPGFGVQVHAADPDDAFVPAERVAALAAAARAAGADLEVFRYPGAGHFFTDRDLPDHDPAAAALAWRRVLAFLDRVSDADADADADGGDGSARAR